MNGQWVTERYCEVYNPLHLSNKYQDIPSGIKRIKFTWEGKSINIYVYFFVTQCLHYLHFCTQTFFLTCTNLQIECRAVQAIDRHEHFTFIAPLSRAMWTLDKILVRKKDPLALQGILAEYNHLKSSNHIPRTIFIICLNNPFIFVSHAKRLDYDFYTTI